MEPALVVANGLVITVAAVSWLVITIVVVTAIMWVSVALGIHVGRRIVDFLMSG